MHLEHKYYVHNLQSFIFNLHKISLLNFHIMKGFSEKEFHFLWDVHAWKYPMNHVTLLMKKVLCIPNNILHIIEK